MRNFILGMMVGVLLAAIGVQAADKEGQRGIPRPPRINDERERQFQLELEHMRKQTELEQARMHGQKQPC
jgi:hypothetical protein